MSKLNFPATQRNREPILSVLKTWLAPIWEDRFVEGHATARPRILEIAAGSGEHSIYLAPALAQSYPQLRWQSSDIDPSHVRSIEAWQHESSVARFESALTLDVLAPEASGVLEAQKYDLLYNANMIHIAPWACTEALFRLAANVLDERGMLFLYGPFQQNGKHTSTSNEEFDQSLKSRDPRWGVRDLVDVDRVARSAGLHRVSLEAMPANNFSVLYSRQH